MSMQHCLAQSYEQSRTAQQPLSSFSTTQPLVSRVDNSSLVGHDQWNHAPRSQVKEQTTTRATSKQLHVRLLMARETWKDHIRQQNAITKCDRTPMYALRAHMKRAVKKNEVTKESKRFRESTRKKCELRRLQV